MSITLLVRGESPRCKDDYAGLDRLDREELDETDDELRMRGDVR